MVSQLDPFIIYTVKLAMDYKSIVELPSLDKETPFKPNQQHTTMAQIMSIKSFPLTAGETVPKLKQDNILSLLYHAGMYLSYNLSMIILQACTNCIR